MRPSAEPNAPGPPSSDAPPPEPRSVRTAVRLYRAAVAVAFPPSFRSDVGAEMVHAFRERSRAVASGRSGSGWARLTFRTVSDLVRHGTAERWSAVKGLRSGFREGFSGGTGADVRHAVRSLASDPAFTGVAVLMLALGVGANTAVFSVVDAVLLRPLPYPDADRVVHVWRTGEGSPSSRSNFSYPDLADLAGAQSTFTELAPYTVRGGTVGVGDAAARVETAVAPPALFRVMGVETSAGRIYDEATPDRPLPLAVVSARLASRLGVPLEPGATIRMDGAPYTVTGVMPADFDFPVGAEVWVPLEGDDNRGSSWAYAIGRLAPGVESERGRDDLTRLMQRVDRAHPGRFRDPGVDVTPLRDAWSAGVRPTLLALMATVVVVLLIACANLAGLGLVRASVRADEFKVRVALGAGRATVVRLVLIESLLLALTGGVAGVALAAWTAPWLRSFAPPGLEAMVGGGLDLRVLGVTMAVAILAGVLSGVVPAVRSADLASTSPVARGFRNGSDRGVRRLRSALVASEVAMAVVLTCGAALLVRSLQNLHTVPLGFDPASVRYVEVTTTLDESVDADRVAMWDLVDRALARLRADPSVRSATAVGYVPFGDSGWGTRVRAERAPILPRPERYLARFNSVTEGYFETLGIAVVRGRAFTAADDRATPVAVITQGLADELWPGGDPLGRRMTNDDDTPGAAWVTVVGVVEDVRNQGFRSDARGEAYQPFSQLPFGRVTFLVDAPWETAGVSARVRSTLASAASGLPVPALRPLADLVDRGRARTRFGTLMVGAFALLAVLLASVGIYGVIAYSVSRGRCELGVRLALGARPAGLVAVTARSGLLPAAVGALGGLGVTLLVGRWIESLLYGVSATDPLTLGGATLLMLAVAAVASVGPALRAARVDPGVALRASGDGGTPGR